MRSSSRTEPPSEPSADERAIRALWDHAAAALCAGDWAGYQRLWARGSDVELLHPAGGEWLVGWDAVGAAYERLLASGFRCAFETRAMRIHVAPGREMAWATAEGLLAPADGSAHPQRTWYTLVFTRERDGWRLVHAHASLPGAP